MNVRMLKNNKRLQKIKFFPFRRLDIKKNSGKENFHSKSSENP